MNKQGILTVTFKKQLTSDVYEMVLEGDACKYISEPGQFINIKLTDTKEPYLRRPMSICEYSESMVRIIFRVVGQGTEILAAKEIGDKMDVLTGLGHGFKMQESGTALLIGGGLGTPPMYELAKQLKAKGIKVITVLGFNSNKELFYEDKFKEFGDVYVATMDGSTGVKGTVIDAIHEYHIQFDEYYTCGPVPMLNALVKAYPENGQLSFEARMGCGFGACMGCSTKVKTKPYKRICKEGPVLLSSEVIIDE